MVILQVVNEQHYIYGTHYSNHEKIFSKINSAKGNNHNIISLKYEECRRKLSTASKYGQEV